ncbi:hypothetical protein ACSFA3_09780 [Variovorax sp. RHLX14]|uniref:hypothetical protein n=1 Tax=Variovorax sp. RHLX14 TaxID=1259731 RepID=UPI003F47A7D9
MPWLRLLVLWIAMIAVPFQAYAAATMAFCGSGHTDPVAATAHEDSGHDHAHDHAAADSSFDSSTDSPTEASHQCATCGACHATALTCLFSAVVVQDLPPADLAEPSFAMATNTSRVPEKPPRG